MISLFKNWLFHRLYPIILWCLDDPIAEKEFLNLSGRWSGRKWMKRARRNTYKEVSLDDIKKT